MKANKIQALNVQPHAFNTKSTPTSFSARKTRTKEEARRDKNLALGLLTLTALGFGGFGAYKLIQEFKVSKNMKTILKELGTEEHNKIKNYLQGFKLSEKLELSNKTVKNLSDYKKDPTKGFDKIKKDGMSINERKDYSYFNDDEYLTNPRNRYIYINHKNDANHGHNSNNGHDLHNGNGGFDGLDGLDDFDV